MSDPFASPPPLASGPVPRDVHMGVVWGEDEEAIFADLARATLGAYPALAGVDWFREQTRRSTVWAVEIRMFQKVIKREVKASIMAETPEEKRAMRDRWLASYGEILTGDIVKAAKNPSLRHTVLESW